MRMWMVDPTILCQQHLLGEHVEIHMFIGSLEKGLIKPGHYPGMLLIHELWSRHEALVHEMRRRGWTGHQTPIDRAQLELQPWFVVTGEIDVEANVRELWKRCTRCRERITSMHSVSQMLQAKGLVTS